MAQVSKISISKIFGTIARDVLQAALDAGTRIHVLRVGGVVQGTRTVTNDYGSREVLTGKFRATNPKTGETTDAPIFIAPDCAHMQLSNVEKGKTLEFGMDIYANPFIYQGPDGDELKYEFVAEDLLPATTANPLDRIFDKMAKSAEPKKGAEKSKK